MKIKPQQLVLVLLAVAGGAFLIAGLRKAGGLPAGVQVSATTEGAFLIPEPVQPVLCMPDEHLGAIVYSTHRYPDRVGGELSTVIHYGHSALSVPNVRDVQWITQPPAEVTL